MFQDAFWAWMILLEDSFMKMCLTDLKISVVMVSKQPPDYK